MEPKEALKKMRENFARWASGEDGARSNPEDFADMQHDLFSEVDAWLVRIFPELTADKPHYPTLNCRRPYCAVPFTGPNAANDRTVHEQKPTDLHVKHGMDFICTDPGHANAIDEAGMCPVCQ